MNIFLDSTIILAASGSASGASRQIFTQAPLHDWTLHATPYVLAEVSKNLPKVGPDAHAQWRALQPQIILAADILAVDLPVVFPVGKDRPVLLSALVCADVLLTLDIRHFGPLMAVPFYGLRIETPGQFLRKEVHTPFLP